MKRLVFLILTLSCAYLSSWAQDKLPNDNLSGMLLSAPNAAHGSGGEHIGVDPFTGRLQAGFTIYSFSSKATGLSHSISLSYQGGGIRVRDLASNAGLGWSLATGGVISRVMNGLPDERVGSGWARTYTYPVPLPSDTELINTISNNYMDSESDEFYYSAGESSGKFVMGKNSEIVTIPLSTTKVERIANLAPADQSPLDSCRNVQFRITTPDGTRYIYSSFDCSCIDTLSTPKRYASSTWYLSMIVSPFDRDTIYFDYVPVLQQYTYGRTYMKYTRPDDPNVNSNWLSREFNRDIYQRTREMRIASIRYPDLTTVNFNYESFPRHDLKTDNALREITITNGLTSSTYGYRFYYSYFNRGMGSVAPPIFPYQDYSGQTQIGGYADHTSSLKLDSFNIFSGANMLPGYKFQYYFSSMSSRFSGSGIDHWGFYSGMATAYQAVSVPGYTLIGSNKAADSADAIQCSLSSIINPQGGTTQLQYELNDVAISGVNVKKGGIRVKKMIFSDGMGHSNDMVREYRYVNENNLSSGVYINDPVYHFKYTEHYVPQQSNSNHPAAAYYLPVTFDYDLVSHYTDPSISSGSQITYVVRFDKPLNALKMIHGSPVGYARVEEYMGTAANNIGKKVYTYGGGIWVPDSIKGNTFPFANMPDVDFAMGLPTGTYSYNAAGLLLDKVINDYDIFPVRLNNANFTSAKVGLKRHSPADPEYSIGYSYPITGKIFPVKMTQTEYYTNGDSITRINETVFDTARMVPRLAKTFNARNEQIVTRYYYPYDFNISGAIAQLNSKGIIYDPVRTEVWKDSTQVLDAGVSTFKQVNSTVKQEASYGLTVANPIPAATWGSFSNTQLLPNSASFTQIANLDQYDQLGNLIQNTAKGTTSSAIWDYRSRLPVAQVSNAAYQDIAYTSFEAESLGGWTLTSGSLTYYNNNAFTGSRYVGFSPNEILKRTLTQNVTYNLTVWTKNGPPSLIVKQNGVNGTVTTYVTPVASDIHQGWQLYRAKVFGNQVEIVTPGTTIQMDELRIYPEGAAMTTCTYDPLYGVTSACDASNRATYFEYDAFGRLKYQRDMDGNIIKARDYKSQDPQN